MSRLTRILYSIATGILLSLAWSQWMHGMILMVAFLPLLYIESYFYRNRDMYGSVHVLYYSALSFVIWNGLSTWWIWNASPIGAVMAILLNTIWMSTVFWLFHISKRKIGVKAGYFALAFYWLAFEYIHLNWDLSWSWLTLGNGFSKSPELVQWYEYTGVLGGSLWILVSNILLIRIIRKQIKYETFHAWLGEGIFLFVWLAVPLIWSWSVYHNYEEAGVPVNIVVIQPNIDPYTEKFTGMEQRDQITRMLNLADSIGNEAVDLFVAPETALPQTEWIHNLPFTPGLNMVGSFLNKYPDAAFVTGLSTRKLFQPGEELTPAARKVRDTTLWYENYNSAIMIDTSGIFQLYHKSKLVIGVETMPFPKTMKFLEKMILNLGGTTGSLGSQPDRGVFATRMDGVRIGPVICYESIFGEYLSGYIRNGATLIFVITNDGWWGDTPGYRQHLHFSRLRAIETRRSVARSANTGVSCFINQRGDLLQETRYWEPDVIREELKANDAVTFYVIYGDFIGRIVLFFSMLILLFTITRGFIKGKADKTASSNQT
jgi:apolipoprotein N-acyltransferase